MNVKQAANVLDLIEYFAARKQPASLAEISKHFGWPRSSTFNLLGTLTQRGYLYEPRPKAGYYPAPVWAVLVNQIEQAQPVPRGVKALLEGLVEKTGETAVLAAASGLSALFIETVESRHPVRYAAHVGKRVPLHVTATGRALLSLMSDDERAAVLKKVDYIKHTSTSLTSAAAVEAEVRAARKKGWFAGNAEFTPDLGGVAVPIALGERHFAVLVGGPMFRIGDGLPKLAKVIRGAVDAYVESLEEDAG